MIKINCHIPNKLNDVSRYVLGFLEKRLGFTAYIMINDRGGYKFEYHNNTFELPSYFVEKESECFLIKRERFNYQIKKVPYFNEIYYGISNEYISRNISLSIDLIGTIFILLSRYEEHVLSDKSFDKFDRLKPDHAINCEHLHIPIVDDLVFLFKALIEKELEVVLHESASEFDVLPSHDVDRPYEYLYYSKKRLLKRVGGDLLKRRSIKTGFERVKLYSKVKKGILEVDPYNTFSWIMDMSDKYDRTSTFHFMVESTDSIFDHAYDLSYSEIRELLIFIYNRGHEIALHPSFKSSIITGQVKKELIMLQKACYELEISQNEFKSRYHYLRWNNNSVIELEKAGIYLDQTLTFAQQPGFRCGTCKSYKAFNFKKMKTSELTIEPLIAMEQSLFSNSYMGLRNNMGEAWNVIKNLKEQCRKHKGNFTLLWHNNELIDQDMKDFYVQCIK